MFIGERGLPGPGDEAWTDDDVEYALAWRELTDSTCGGCGEPRSESFAKENHDAYDVKALVCHACAERDREMNALKESGMEMAGLHLIVKKTERRMP